MFKTLPNHNFSGLLLPIFAVFQSHSCTNPHWIRWSYVLSVTFAQEYIAPEVLLNKGHGSSARSWSCTWHISSVHARIGSPQIVASLAVLDTIRYSQIMSNLRSNLLFASRQFPTLSTWVKICLHQKPMKVNGSRKVVIITSPELHFVSFCSCAWILFWAV